MQIPTALPSYERTMVDVYCAGGNSCWKVPEDVENKIAEAFLVSVKCIAETKFIS